MNNSLSSDIQAWEDEGGVAPGPPALGSTLMAGTPNQVEWAVRIKRQVNAEFDRVAASFRLIANRQNGSQRTDTEAIIAILEDKRVEVVRREDAGYFIHDWQEIGDQVRQMIFHDPRYRAIRSNKAARRQSVYTNGA
jgi:uncharacterized protein with von Willebrand factor type A (vWA) domain